MHTSDADELVELAILPQSALEAPTPLIVAAGGRLFLAYGVRVERARVPSLDVERLVEAITRSLDAPASDEGPVENVSPLSVPAALVEFREPARHAFHLDSYAVERHPLAARGLHAHAAFEVYRSSWLNGTPGAEGRHFIVAFAGAVFECIAAGVRMTLLDGMEHAAPEIQRRLQARDTAGDRVGTA